MSDPGVCDTENVADHVFVTMGKEQVRLQLFKIVVPNFLAAIAK